MALKMAALEEAVVDAWWALRHRASLLHLRIDPPDGLDDATVDLIWPDWLAGENAAALDGLREEVRERFGYDLHFNQYGRGGATVAPAEWAYENVFTSCGLRWNALPLADWGLERYNDLRRVRAVLEYVGQYVDAYVRALPAAWRDYVAGLDGTDISEEVGDGC